MTVADLIQELQRKLDVGEIRPNTIVVRPACMCDDEYGYIEAEHVDQVARAFEGEGTDRVYKYGSGRPEPNVLTIKLG